VFDVGFWEVSLIAIVALIVVGPDRLPGMTRTAGQLIGRAKRTLRELKYDLEREAEFAEMDRLKGDFSKNPIDDFAKTLEQSIDVEEERRADDKTES
jgi:sec-independent protein translocase protein TatB